MWPLLGALAVLCIVVAGVSGWCRDAPGRICPMNDGGPWVAALILVVVALGIVSLSTYARGPQHHHGDEIGTHGTPPARSR